MNVKTIICANNNISPIQQICISTTNTDIEPFQEELINIDYESLSASEKTQFADFVAMIESKQI